MTKNVLFAGVSALALALSATVALADGDFNNAGGTNNITTNGSTQLVGGNQSLNTIGVETNSENGTENNTNALNEGQISGGNSNIASGNNITADNNLSGNTTVSGSLSSFNLNSDHSRNYTNSASFAGAENVAVNVLNSTVAMNSADFDATGSTSVQGNVIDSNLNSFAGAASLVQNNGVQNNVQAALSVNVGTYNAR